MKNIVYLGNADRGLICLQHLVEKNYPIRLVMVHPTGVEQNPIALYSQQQGIEVIHPENINSPHTLDLLKKISPDLMILSGYSQIIRKPLIDLPLYGCINLHGGKLPAYRGSSPINWSIINGEKEGGISIIKVDEGIDTGPILAEETFAISMQDDAATIKEKTLKLFPELLVSVLEKMKAGTLTPLQNRLDQGTYYPCRQPKDGLILWEQMTAQEIFNLVRGLTKPFPGAFTFLASSRQKLFVWKATYLNEHIHGVPGRVIQKRDASVLVMCKDKCIALECVQLDKEKACEASALLNRGDEFLTSRTFYFC